MIAYVDEVGRIIDTPPDPAEREEINLEDIQISVPKDEDIVGGEAGKTFTTTSHLKVPTWYARVREERGND